MGALPHGYTNETVLWGSASVEKRYRWADARERREREVHALRALATRLPVPPVLEDRAADNVVRLALLPGRHGQELIDEGHARTVLRLLGELLRRLQDIDVGLLGVSGPETAAEDAGPVGGVIVHGDFGPQNALLDLDAGAVTALLDWEWVHIGSAVEDLAWAEWAVRTHHPRHLGALDALFAGYGERPTWPERHGAMIATCRFHIGRAGRLGDSAVADQWVARLAQTTSWRDEQQ